MADESRPPFFATNPSMQPASADPIPAPDTNVPAISFEARIAAIEENARKQAEETRQTREENERLTAQIAAMQSAARGKIAVTRFTCNVCGDECETEEGCPKHPYEFVNHAGPGPTGEEMLAKQTRTARPGNH